MSLGMDTYFSIVCLHQKAAKIKEILRSLQCNSTLIQILCDTLQVFDIIRLFFVLLRFVLVVSAGLAVAGLAQAQVGVAAPVMSQPGIATPTVYSISNTQPSLAQQQYTQQQVALAGVQVFFYVECIFTNKHVNTIIF